MRVGEEGWFEFLGFVSLLISECLKKRVNGVNNIIASVSR